MSIGAGGLVFEDFETTPPQLINQVGQSIETPTMAITLIERRPSLPDDFSVEIQRNGSATPPIMGNTLNVHTNGDGGGVVLRMNLKSQVLSSDVSFWYTMFDAANGTAKVIFYDAQGVEIERRTLVNDGQQPLECRSTRGSIAWVELVLDSVAPLVMMDSFTWRE